MVVCDKAPETPLTVTVNVPPAAALVAVNATVLLVVAGFGLNVALTPLGNPVAEKVT